MPIYEYECTDCGNVIEVIQKIDARAPGRCEECSGKLKKLVSRASFQLKGGGWYSDGYTDGGGTTSSKPSGSSDKAKKKKDGGSSKTKKAASA